MEPRADDRLHRKVGPLGASLSGIGIVLGAGIYVLVGEAAGEAGNAVWLAFLVGALLAAATGLSYAELTSTIPEAGAAAAFAQEAFGSRVAFVTGWMDVLVNLIGAPAVAIGFAGYFVALVGGDPVLVAAVTLLLCAAVVLAGVGETIRLASVFAVIELLGLLVVLVVGVPFLGEVNLADVDQGAAGILAAAALVFFAYEGFEEIATLSEEVRDPSRNIPRALLIAIGVTTALYVLVAAVAVSVVPAEELAGQPAPLAAVVAVATNERIADGLSVVALFATFNTALLLIATGPRAMYGMARRRILPPVLGRVSRRGVPWVAVTIAAIVAVAFSVTGDIGYVAQVTNFAVFTLFVVVNSSVIRLRWTQPKRARPFTLRPNVGRLPLIPIVGLAGSLLLGWYMERNAAVTGAVALFLGIALSFLFVRLGPPDSSVGAGDPS